MGNNCSCKVIPKDSQLPAPQEERATSSKVVPKKKSYRKTKRNPRHCKPSHDSGAAGSSSSSAEVARVEKPAGFINTKSHKDSRISKMETVCLVEKSCGPAGDMNILEENSVESEINTNEMDADNIKAELDADDHDEDDSGSNMESEHIHPRDQGYSSDIDETEESEHSPDVLSDKDQMKTTPKEETNTSPTKVQSRKCRWIRSLVRRLGLWHTKSSCIKPQTSTVRMIDKACNTSEVIVALKKPGVRCCITERNTERSEPLLVTTVEKACGTADDSTDESEFADSEDFVSSTVSTNNAGRANDPAELGEGPFGPPRIAWT